MAEPDTLCGWGDQDKVDYFVQRSAFLIPKRLEQLSTLLDLFLGRLMNRFACSI